MADKSEIDGVGILYYPPGQVAITDPEGRGCTVSTRKIAREVADQIKPGIILTLPSNRDSDGNLYWDFRIERGDLGQVEVRRSDDSIPHVENK